MYKSVLFSLLISMILGIVQCSKSIDKSTIHKVTKKWARVSGFGCLEMNNAQLAAILAERNISYSDWEQPANKQIIDQAKKKYCKLSNYRVPKNKRLKKRKIKDMNRNELVLMRNSVFANYGYEFKTPWIRTYFQSRKWYKAGGFEYSMLTKIDNDNIKLIQKVEEKFKKDQAKTKSCIGYRRGAAFGGGQDVLGLFPDGKAEHNVDNLGEGFIKTGTWTSPDGENAVINWTYIKKRTGYGAQEEGPRGPMYSQFKESEKSINKQQTVSLGSMMEMESDNCK